MPAQDSSTSSVLTSLYIEQHLSRYCFRAKFFLAWSFPLCLIKERSAGLLFGWRGLQGSAERGTAREQNVLSRSSKAARVPFWKLGTAVTSGSGSKITALWASLRALAVKSATQRGPGPSRAGAALDHLRFSFCSRRDKIPSRRSKLLAGQLSQAAGAGFASVCRNLCKQ